MTGINFAITSILIILITTYFATIFVSDRVTSVIYLIGSYILVTILSILLGFQFIAVTILIVYVGAISIFFLFIVMALSNRGRIIEIQGDAILAFFSLLVIYSNLLYIIDGFFIEISANGLGLGQTGLPIFELINKEWSNSANTEQIDLSTFKELLINTNTANNTKLYNLSNVVLSDNLFKLSPTFTNDVTEAYNSNHLSHQYLSVPANDLFTYTNENISQNFIVISESNIEAVGLILFSSYLFAFLLCGFLLLAALVGVTGIFHSLPKTDKSREVIVEQLLHVFSKQN